jgi:methyl-accepting chemotaxis protein
MTWRKVWREKDKMTLRKKLMLSFLILVLLMGSMIGYFSYQNAKNLVLDNKEQEMADTINRIDISINSQVQQINRLAENVKSSQIVRGYLKKEIHTQEESKAHDEIGMLIQSFNYMVSRLRQLIMEVYQQKLAQKNAELTALLWHFQTHL